MPKIDSDPEGLKPYISHGVDLQWKNGAKDAYATECPFCQRENVFAVTIERSTYRCNVCPESGNQYVFLRKLHEMSLEGTTQADYQELADNRQLLKWETLKSWAICKSSITDKWLVPGYGADGAMNNLYRYDFNHVTKRMMLFPTPTTGHQLLGRNTYDKKKQTVYLTEGWSDGAALYEALSVTKEWFQYTDKPKEALLSNSNVLAIPGAMVFNDSWLPLFSNKDVVLMGQNDHENINEKTGQKIAPASYAGMQRIAKMLQTMKEPPLSIKYLKWGDGGFNPKLKHGADVRDALTGQLVESE